MGNSAARPGVPSGSAVEVYSDYDENTINRGTSNRPKPLLKFHSVHGTNVMLFNDGRIARRKDSFCKGLAFSNRPISIDEIVCLRLCDVGTNWSGVLRFGVTNVDPASFRDIELPKFACPDLTSKAGYWAKALAERYSIEKSILHFFVNDAGEMYYGINGVNKGMFLNGINVSIPIWIIIDIYGNSVGVEFVDPGDVHLDRARTAKCLKARRNHTPPFSTNHSQPREESNNPSDGNTAIVQHSTTNHNGTGIDMPATTRPSPSMTSSTSANNLGPEGNPSGLRSSSTRTSPFSYTSNSTRLLRFHTVHGVNITLHADDTIASRKHGEYYLGYVFTERPLKIGEKLAVVILQVEQAFSGSLAFGLTSCDPIQVPASRLPVDSDELLERPEYWVCIKDVGAMPAVGDKLSFHIDDRGQVTFSKNDAPPRVIMHVDISVNLWAFFDLYGTTRKIQILDQVAMSGFESVRNYRASSEGTAHPAPNTASPLRANRPASTAFNFNLDSLRVALPPEPSSSAENVRSGSTNELPIVSSVQSGFTISPSSSSSAPLGVDPVEIARLRASILSNGRSNYSDRQTTNPISISRPTNESDSSSRSPFSDFLSRRRAAASALSSSPRDSPRDNTTARTTTFADIFESNLSSLSTPPATITVPLLPPPLFSSLATSVSNNHSRSDSTLSTQRPSDEGRAEQEKDSAEAQNEQNQSYSECSICMNSRVNAVIYRCGHMCMCFGCAKETHRRSGDCPICRTPIIDVIRCYPA